MAEQVQRKLAAIFAADVEGYSRLMGIDEVGTLRTLTNRSTPMADGENGVSNGRSARRPQRDEAGQAYRSRTRLDRAKAPAWLRVTSERPAWAATRSPQTGARQWPTEKTGYPVSRLARFRLLRCGEAHEKCRIAGLSAAPDGERPKCETAWLWGQSRANASPTPRIFPAYKSGPESVLKKAKHSERLTIPDSLVSGKITGNLSSELSSWRTRDRRNRLVFRYLRLLIRSRGRSRSREFRMRDQGRVSP